MTKKQAIVEVRKLGLTAEWSYDWQEFTLNYRLEDPRRTKDSDYCCPDTDDLLGTARYMASR